MVKKNVSEDVSEAAHQSRGRTDRQGDEKDAHLNHPEGREDVPPRQAAAEAAEAGAVHRNAGEESTQHEVMDRGAHGRDVDHTHPADAAVEEHPGAATGVAQEPPRHEAHTMEHAAHGGPRASEAGSTHEEHEAPDGHGEHVSHAGHEQMFRRKFWVSLVLSIPVLVFSPSIQGFLGYELPDFPLSAWITPVFAVVIFVYGGLPFLQMAVPELRHRQPGMMTLISLAISVAFLYSMAALFLPESDTFFWELVTLIDVMLLGHWLEMRSVRQASGALDELAKLMPDTAERIGASGEVNEVPVSRLQEGDLVLVRPGASIPADGEVVEGESHVNEAMVTGESKPVSKAPGESVIAGTLNGDGSLRVRVTATGEATALAGIMRLVREAQQSKSNTQILADRAAGWLFYVALGVAVVTAIAWTIAVGFSNQVIARVATVLVIACPHALGLAIPLVIAITTSLGARNGILVRDRLALEEARAVDMVIFDKTGTLTRGEFGVVGIETMEGWEDDEALALAAAVETDSEHTIARGIRRSAEERGLTLPAASDFEALKGRGVKARLDGRVIYVGGPRLLEMLNLNLPESLTRFEQQASERGQSVVNLVENDRIVAAFALADVIRPESREAVDQLHAMGIEVAMLTGDSEAVARTVAEELGIDTYFAEVLPEHKDQKVMDLQQQGKRVAMVGDGVNDAPALARADVGIAIGSGTDVAVESAGIILVQNDPRDAVNAIDLSRATYRKMVQNLFWATAYNVVALPLAAGILAPLGIVLSPAVGAALMALSTVIVAINAQLLRRHKFVT